MSDPLERSERKAVHEVVSNVAYPSYDDFTSQILTHPELIFAFAEYSETNHELLCALYKAGAKDADAIRAAGQVIGERGGLQAMQGCYYAFTNGIGWAIEKAYEKESEYYGLSEHHARAAVPAFATLLKSNWEGVCGWVN